jgi:hypothetical protein
MSGEQIQELANRSPIGARAKRSAWEFANATGKQIVFEAMKWDSETGKPIGKVYVDQDGNEVDPGKLVFVPMHHPDAVKLSQDFFRRGAA